MNFLRKSLSLLCLCASLVLISSPSWADSGSLRLENQTNHRLHVTGHHESHYRDMWVDLGDIPPHSTETFRLMDGRWSIRGTNREGRIYGPVGVHMHDHQIVSERFIPNYQPAYVQPGYVQPTYLQPAVNIPVTNGVTVSVPVPGMAPPPPTYYVPGH